ncbi:hypothetical protein BH10BAC5_BH10BAC5_12500 [soil metagenome]
MKNYFYYLLLLVVLCFTSVSINAEQTLSISGAAISFEELQYDFGKVDQGELLEHIFKFNNTGSEILIIQSVQSSCGCTGATIGDKKEYAPGESGEIKVTFNTQGREGVNNKTISVSSNDPNKSITLSFICEIIKNKIIKVK